MHEYDGIDNCYKSSSGHSEKAISHISEILGFKPDLGKLDYELHFYSGGSGIIDREAFSCILGTHNLQAVVAKLDLISVEAALDDPDLSEDFSILLDREECECSVEESLKMFIDIRRKKFQSPYSKRANVFFTRDSGVNGWTAIWEEAGRINYLNWFQQ